MTQLFELGGGVELTTLDGEYGMYIVEKDSGGTPTQSRFVTLATLKEYINTDPTVIPSSNPWRGCRVQLTADEDIATGSEYTSVIWDTEHVDSDSIWTIAAPTRLTVPAGVTKVRLSASTSWAPSTTGASISLNMNGSIAPGGFAQRSLSALAAASSAAIDVSPGDYFELRANHTTGSTRAIAAEGRTWFEMTIVEATP